MDSLTVRVLVTQETSWLSMCFEYRPIRGHGLHLRIRFRFHATSRELTAASNLISLDFQSESRVKKQHLTTEFRPSISSSEPGPGVQIGLSEMQRMMKMEFSDRELLVDGI